MDILYIYILMYIHIYVDYIVYKYRMCTSRWVCIYLVLKAVCLSSVLTCDLLAVGSNFVRSYIATVKYIHILVHTGIFNILYVYNMYLKCVIYIYCIDFTYVYLYSFIHIYRVSYILILRTLAKICIYYVWL